MAVSTGNPFVVDQSTLGRGLGALGGAFGAHLGKQAQQEEMKQQQALAEQKKQEVIQKGLQVFESGDPYAMAEFSLQNPQMGETLNAQVGARDEQQKKELTDFARGFLALPEEQRAAAWDARINYLEQSGRDATQSIQAKDEYLANPEAETREMEMFFAGQSPNEYKAYKGGQPTQQEPLTKYQEESLNLRKSQQELDLLKLERQGETNSIQKKKLSNEIRLQEQKIRKADLEAKALEAGPTAQEILSKSSEAQKKASSFAQRMTVSADELNTLAESVDPTSRVIPLIAGGGGVISETANRLASPEEQQYASAASDFVTAQLRKESGAVIGESEFKRKFREFFPVPGDSDKQIESKRKRRERAAESMQKESGGLYEALYKKESRPAIQGQQQYNEGMTATNPSTGEVMVFRNGSWEAQ